MAENKTKPTGAGVEDYIASRANAQQSSDCRELMVLLKKVTRQSPQWGPASSVMAPTGTPTRVDELGKPLWAGFAIRGRELVVYLSARTRSKDPCCPSLASTRWARLAVQAAADS